MSTTAPLLLPAEAVTRPANAITSAVAMVRDREPKGLSTRKAPVFGKPFGQYLYDAAGHYQSSLGSCVGCAFTGFLNATPFPTRYDQAWANELYYWCRGHDGARDNDGDPLGGTFPGTAVKRLKQLGLVEQKSGIAVFEKDARAWSLGGPPNLPARIVLFGVKWREAMYRPDADGRLHPKGAIVGGHEFEAYFDSARNVWVGLQSWAGYGPFDALGQRFYLTKHDMRVLMAWGGIATLLTKVPR